MAKAKEPKAKKTKPQKPSGRPLTDKESTFLREYFKCKNATEAARRTFDCTEHSARSMGSEYLAKLRPYVAQWLDEEGLTERYLKEKLLEGLDATEVKVFNASGVTVAVKEKDGEEPTDVYVPGQIVYSEPLIAWGPRGVFLKLAMQSAGMLKEPELPPGAGTGTLRVIVEVQGAKDAGQGGVTVEVQKPEEGPR